MEESNGITGDTTQPRCCAVIQEVCKKLGPLPTFNGDLPIPDRPNTTAAA